ncbi:hypothetical protein C0993_001570 [Termitomyces sp. T159_Od127]|nr:hypothetical protein C0993_001570 [Termitomyces sp. T159_Od127]
MDIFYGPGSGKVGCLQHQSPHIKLIHLINSIGKLERSASELLALSVQNTEFSLADIVKMIDSQPDLAPLIRRVRGGYLKIQGTWMPYERRMANTGRPHSLVWSDFPKYMSIP